MQSFVTIVVSDEFAHVEDKQSFLPFLKHVSTKWNYSKVNIFGSFKGDCSSCYANVE